MNCNFSRQLMIEINPNGDLYYTHCCVLFNELIKCERVEKLLNSENAFEYLNNIYHTNPINHNFHPTNNDCRGVQCCDFSSDADFNFLTISHKACNINCKSCVVDRAKGKDEVIESERLYMEILKKIKGMHLHHLQLSSSGEPFLFKKNTVDYIASLTEEDTQAVGFVTNAIALNENDINYMCEETKKHNVWLSSVISCDGITPETYKANRGVDAFETVMKNIMAFRNQGRLTLVNYVIMPENIHELREVPDFWLSKGITPRIIYPILHPEWDWMRTHENVEFIKNNFPQYFANN